MMGAPLCALGLFVSLMVRAWIPLIVVALSFLVYFGVLLTFRYVIVFLIPLDAGQSEGSLHIRCIGANYRFPLSEKSYIIQGVQNFIIVIRYERTSLFFVPRKALWDDNASEPSVTSATGLAVRGRTFWDFWFRWM